MATSRLKIDKEPDAVREFVNASIAARCRDRRKEIGLSRNELARLMGRSFFFVSRIERAVEATINLYDLLLLARALRVTPAFFIDPLNKALGLEKPIFLPITGRPIGQQKIYLEMKGPKQKDKENGID